MPLENATTIEGLDSTWPLGLDSASRGDDHLRLLKAVLKAQFPGASGRGYSKPITITEDQLNSLPSQIADIGNKYFPVGTVVLRMDNKNPSYIYGGTWSLITGDASLTFGNGAAQTGAIVGSNTSVVPVPAHSHNASHSLIAETAGNHRHPIRTGSQRMSIDDVTGQWFRDTNVIRYTEYAGDHTHSIAGSVTVESSGISDATIDVSGARIAINVWKRTA